MSKSSIAQKHVDEIGYVAGVCRHDPLMWINAAYEWGTSSVNDAAGLREWQKNICVLMGEHLQDPETRHKPLLIAVSSGHGIGKSAFIGMLINWAINEPNTRIICTANTEMQLRTKLIPEVTKWQKNSINSSLLDVQATSIAIKDRTVSRNWRADFVTWSENNTEAFAGLHNKGNRIVIIYDEASGIADKVWEVTEGALTDSETEIIWIVFGNPTKPLGRFRECFRQFAHRWKTYSIDSRDVEGAINLELTKQWEKDWGEDSDFFRVRVRGLFPNSSTCQFIQTEDVEAAFGKQLAPQDYNFAPVILGVDPAWEGADEFAIVLRQGLYSKVLATYPFCDDGGKMAGVIARLQDQYGADAVFIDYGYGQSIHDFGKRMGRNWQMVQFGASAFDKSIPNKRTEMWREMRQWLKDGGAIPKDQVLFRDLVDIERVIRSDGKEGLMTKKDMKAMGLRSPNRADALALTFAMPVVKNLMPTKIKMSSFPIENYGGR